MWNCLLKLKEEFPNPWCLGGDFNEIRQIGDRRGCSRRDRGMKDFNEFIDKCEISDLPLLGRRFTWCNSYTGEKWSRIDRIFVDPKWLEVFNIKLWGLPRMVSDHCPLLMMEDERDWGPKPFRVLNAWFLHKNFQSFWESKWQESAVEGWAGFILTQKLKLLKNNLKSWNVEVFGNVVNKLKSVEGDLHSLDLLAEVRDLDGEEKVRRSEARIEMWRLSRMVEWLWLQKSRLNWTMKGDKNTRFFHVITKCRTIRNEINSITEGDVVFEEPRHVKSKVLEYFQNQFSESWAARPVLGGHFPSVLDRARADLLEAEFTEAEIKSAVMECDGNKAPGPDGFNMLCFQKFWNVMKGEVINFVNEFHRNGKLVKGINSSFITLIPKKDNPIGLTDYRPISLVGSTYKILAKLLAKRLKSVMPFIISEPQSAFLSGRNILDGVLIANEVVEGWKKAKKKGVLIQLDFEKAYDSINWGFLFSMLKKLGFGAKWVNWMKECITSTRVSVLVNGSPTEEFSPQRGLRQGDPLSPFLFNLVAEGLHLLLSRACELNLIKGVKVGSKGVLLSHLQFADDSLLFCEAEVEEVRKLKRVLRCFEILSGLKINFHKSAVCGVGVSTARMNEMAAVLNCKVKKLPLTYLGLPLGANPRKKATWKPVVDKVKSKLAGWKRKMLSFAGRLILVKTVTSALPVFYLSLFKLPEGVASELDRLQATFLWGGSEQVRKIHMIKWEDLSKGMDQGGLGIRNLRNVNKCLLIKWWWRFACEKDALWKRVICSKYKMGVGDWIPSLTPSNKFSPIWRGIISAADQCTSLKEHYLNNFQLKVGDGQRISFWADNWRRSGCLKDEFPTLFRLSLEKKETLSILVDKKIRTGGWALAFRRELYDWEKLDLARLLNTLLEAPDLRPGCPDQSVWLASSSGILTVADLYKSFLASAGDTLSITKLIWLKLIPPKVQVFCWFAWKGRVKTKEYLQRLGVLDQGASTTCVFCGSESESVNHVLIWCPFVWKIWAEMLRWWDTKAVIPGSVETLLWWWAGGKLRKLERKIWGVIPMVVMWSTWKCRNECVFSAITPNLEDLCEVIKLRIAFWVKPYFPDFCFTVQDFICNLSQIRRCLGGSVGGM
ncbi:unnamed protein product [Camellia sinensis]